MPSQGLSTCLLDDPARCKAHCEREVSLTNKQDIFSLFDEKSSENVSRDELLSSYLHCRLHNPVVVSMDVHASVLDCGGFYN